jgi:hypothetical protein
MPQVFGLSNVLRLRQPRSAVSKNGLGNTPSRCVRKRAGSSTAAMEFIFRKKMFMPVGRQFVPPGNVLICPGWAQFFFEK